MGKQLYYEDVEEGTEIPSLEKRPSEVQLFLYGAITRNPHRIHYDEPFARSEEHPGVLVHGPLQAAFLTNMLMNWIGEEGFLRKLSFTNRGRVIPGDVVTCKGRVIHKHEQDGQHLAECEIWEENQRGEVTIQGAAEVMLPRRKIP
jgi:3-methylfumaryl-CoA hydratase